MTFLIISGFSNVYERCMSIASTLRWIAYSFVFLLLIKIKFQLKTIYYALSMCTKRAGAIIMYIVVVSQSSSTAGLRPPQGYTTNPDPMPSA